jgi:hypothetical protein
MAVEDIFSNARRRIVMELSLDGQPTQLPSLYHGGGGGSGRGKAPLRASEPPILKQLNYMVILNTKIN